MYCYCPKCSEKIILEYRGKSYEWCPKCGTGIDFQTSEVVCYKTWIEKLTDGFEEALFVLHFDEILKFFGEFRIFNSAMIWGAVLSWLIFYSLGDIIRTYHHHGGGMIHTQEENGTEHEFYSNESAYKLQHYLGSGFFLVLGVFLWSAIARDDDRRPKVPENRNYQDTTL